MNNRDYRILIKIIDEVVLMKEMVDGYTQEKFLSDEKTKRAVSMTLINIGELVKNLTEEFRLTNKSVPWKSIAGLRNVTAHKYQTLDMGDIWITLKEDIPVLEQNIQVLIDKTPDGFPVTT